MGLPLSASTPLPSDPPQDSALRVEIVGDEFGLWLSILAAVVGAVAAIASWRAATAARKAAEIGEESAKYARDAASAAQKTAEAEQAMMEMARYERRARQASEIYVAWAGLSNGPKMERVVELHVANRSGLLVSDVEYWGMFDGAVVSAVVTARHLNADTTPIIRPHTTSPIPDTYDIRKALGVIRFTDINGVRWERRTNAAPKELSP